MLKNDMAHVLLSLLCGILLLVYFLWKRWVNKFAKFRGPPPTFLVGVAHKLKREPDEFVAQIMGWFDDFNGEVMLWLGLKPFLMTAQPEHAEAVLSSTKHITKAHEYDFLHQWLGTGLLTSTGFKWKQRRRLLTPAFHFSILKDFAEVFKESSSTFISQLKPLAVTGKSFDMCKYTSLCTLDAICETAMGVRCNAQVNSESEYCRAVLSMSGLIQERQKSPWLWPNFIYNLTGSGRQHNRAVKLMHEFTLKVIKDKIKAKKEEKDLKDDKEKPKKRLAFLDILIDSVEGGEIDIDGLREEVDTFMFEGHDTTASGISWTLYLLGRHPEIQQKAHQEVEEVFDKFGSENFVDAARELKYLECVLKESMRLYPPVPIVGRDVHEDLQLGDRILYKGSTVAVGIIALHHNEKLWHDPKKFDPDRFLSENFAKHNPYGYVPFSAGPRNCIGQKFALLEEKIVVSTFLRHYKITSFQEEESLKPCGELILRPKDGLKVKISKRDG